MSSPYHPPILTPSLPSSPIRSHHSTSNYLINLSPMADRFPDLDDFGTGTAPTPPHDPSSDFLTRERAALGDDAAQFGNDHAARVDDGGDADLLGGDGSHADAGGDDEMMDEFEKGFPAVDGAMPPSGPTTTLPFQPSPGASNDDDEEPEPIKTWRTHRHTALTQRSTLAASKRATTVTQAQQHIDDFYESYNVRKEKGMKKTRGEAEAFLKAREDMSAGGTSWERVARLLDLGKGGKGGKGMGEGGEGKERFRDLLLGLRGDEGAPGVGGY